MRLNLRRVNQRVFRQRFMDGNGKSPQQPTPHSLSNQRRRLAAFGVFTPLGDKTIRWAAPVKAWPVCRLASSRAIATQSPGLDWGRTADYPLVTRGNTLYKSGKCSVNGGVLGVSPNKWNFAVKIPYLLGQRHLRFRCPSRQNSAP